MNIIGTNLVIPDNKIPVDMSIFTKERCERAEDWHKKHGIPIMLPHQDWKECKKMYHDLKQKRIFWQKRSDEAAMLFFGMTNEDIYRRLKGHFESDGKVSRGETVVNESVEVLNELGLNHSLSIISEQIKHGLGNVDEYRLRKISEYFKPKKINVHDLILRECYFTPFEIVKYRGIYSDKALPVYDYNGFLEEYNLFFNGINGEKFHNLGLERVKLLQKFGLEPEENDNRTKETLLRLGWNPNIPYNEDGIYKSYNRLKEVIEEDTKNIEMVDLSELVKVVEGTIEEDSFHLKDYKPCFIVFKRTLDSAINSIITKTTNSFWAHAAISFDPNLKQMYTFDMFHHGFTKESIYQYKKGTIINVVCCFVTNDSYNKMMTEIQRYKDNKKDTSYGFQNFIACLSKKANENTMSMVCSNFVDYMMKIGDISPTKSSYSIMHPGRLRRSIASNKKKRFYNVYKGTIEDYNASKVMLYLSTCNTGAVKLTEEDEIDKLSKETQELYKQLVEPYINMEVILEDEVKPVDKSVYEIKKLYFINS